MDEPSEGLDPATATAVLTDLLDATRGRTTLLVTHDRTCLAAADRVVTLDRGRIRPVTEDEIAIPSAPALGAAPPRRQTPPLPQAPR
ncbi:hypothetical protein [Streptomyces sp. NPDC051561]|uniref:hypothetical protein n=1 Tax=Streptomyces sp. NPDC051561 TaxID=3365658 RepID=UPI003788164A